MYPNDTLRLTPVQLHCARHTAHRHAAVAAGFYHPQICTSFHLMLPPTNGCGQRRTERTYGLGKGKKYSTNKLCGWRGGRPADKRRKETNECVCVCVWPTTVGDLRYALHRSNETAKLNSRLSPRFCVCEPGFICQNV